MGLVEFRTNGDGLPVGWTSLYVLPLHPAVSAAGLQVTPQQTGGGSEEHCGPGEMWQAGTEALHAVPMEARRKLWGP